MITAQLCRSWCGDIERPRRGGQASAAALACLSSTFEARARHRLSFGIDDEFGDADVSPAPAAKPENRSQFPSKAEGTAPCGPCLGQEGSAFTEGKGLPAWRRPFRDAQPCGEAQMQHRPIAQAQAHREIRRVQDRAHFLNRQMRDELLMDRLVGMARICPTCSGVEGT